MSGLRVIAAAREVSRKRRAGGIRPALDQLDRVVAEYEAEQQRRQRELVAEARVAARLDEPSELAAIALYHSVTKGQQWDDLSETARQRYRNVAERVLAAGSVAAQ